VTLNGQDYPTVQIGSHVWFAKNLDEPTTSGSWCFYGVLNDMESGESNTLTAEQGCALFGRYYDWSTAMALDKACNTKSCSGQVQTPHQGICPDGWHIPTNAEWEDLAEAVGGRSTAGTRLKSSLALSAGGWASDNKYSDSYGFSALPAGNALKFSWNDESEEPLIGNAVLAGSYWWSADEGDQETAYKWYLFHTNESLASDMEFDKIVGLNVRCVQNQATSP
jgi:uncharacterized protein (TIGR02145 family)